VTRSGVRFFCWRNEGLVLSSRLIPRIDRPWKTAFWQTVALALMAVVLGLIVNQLRSDSLPLPGDWSPGARITMKFGKNILIPFDEAKEKFFTGAAVFIDARAPELYQEGHIKGALNLPIAEFDQLADKVLMDFPEDTLIVTYCDGDDCALSAELALKLKEIGYENVRVLHNGWTEWKSHQLPFEGAGEQEG
jgi:rhodanese-related sulfurtransferase